MNNKNIIYIAGAAAVLFIGYLIWRDNKEKKEGNPPKKDSDSKNDSSSSSSGDGTGSSSSSSIVYTSQYCQEQNIDNSKKLSIGSVGCEVRELQRLMNQTETGNPESPLVLDGVFGSATDNLMKDILGAQQNDITLFTWYLLDPSVYSGA